MLLDANLSYTFWTEAVTVTNYLQNRLPTKGIETIPYEEWRNPFHKYQNK